MGYSSIGRGDGLSLGQPRRMGTARGIGSPPHVPRALSRQDSVLSVLGSQLLRHSHRRVQRLAPAEQNNESRCDQNLHQGAKDKQWFESGAR